MENRYYIERPQLLLLSIVNNTIKQNVLGQVAKKGERENQMEKRKLYSNSDNRASTLRHWNRKGNTDVEKNRRRIEEDNRTNYTIDYSQSKPEIIERGNILGCITSIIIMSKVIIFKK